MLLALLGFKGVTPWTFLGFGAKTVKSATVLSLIHETPLEHPKDEIPSVFRKGEQSILSFYRFFLIHKERTLKMAQILQVAIHFHPIHL